MFIGTRARIMAAAAMLGALMGFESRPVSPGERRYAPLLPTPTEPPAVRRTPSVARVAQSWGRWIRPRQEGETGRRFRQIIAGTYTASNGLVGPGGVKVNSHGVLA